MSRATWTCFRAKTAHLRGQFEPAAVLARECLQAALQAPEGNELAVALLYTSAGEALNYSGHTEEALAAQQKALELRRGVTGDLNAMTAMYYNNIADAGAGSGNWELGISAGTHALDLLRLLPGADPSYTAITALNLGECYFGAGKLERAEASYRIALRKQAVMDRVPGMHVMLLNDVALVQLRRGDHPKARATYAESKALALSKLAPIDDDRRRAILGFAWTETLTQTATAAMNLKVLQALAVDLQQHPTAQRLDVGLIRMALAEVTLRVHPRSQETRALMQDAKQRWRSQHQDALAAWVDTKLEGLRLPPP